MIQCTYTSGTARPGPIPAYYQPPRPYHHQLSKNHMIPAQSVREVAVLK